ncbi:Trypanosomal VSG domain containing protein, putative [Trypanosoma equiperdum]|uniref:Trypanosomal VSG domain containing protein, putative n=1 Tax=Trypanosoma equiperdum TaxID=5694 RepID=A0A1G4IGN1_TRYEQ|nr:Trypanosomal VSG domain containing protein, putative [Trypanosoma equiperdum]
MAQTKVNQVLLHAIELFKNDKEAQTAIDAGTKAKIDAKLVEAAYGGKDEKAKYETDGSSHAAAKAVAGCNQDGSISNKQTIAYTMQCLTLQDSAATARPLGGTASPGQWDNANDNLGTEFAKVKKSCPKGTGGELTPESIRSLLRNLRSHIKVIDANGYLGEFLTTGCTGHSGSGLCVKYTKITDSKDEFNTLTFVKALTDAANLLEARQKAVEKRKQLKEALVLELKRAYNVAAELQLQVQAHATGRVGTQPADKAAATDQNKKTNAKQ